MRALFSRNFLLFVFFVAKSSTYKCYNSAFGVQSTSLPVQKRIPIVRLCYGTGWVEVPCDYGSERGKVGEPCDYGSERIWCSRVILWCGTEAFLGGDIMVRNGMGLRVFHGIFCVKFTVLRCFFNILTLFSPKGPFFPLQRWRHRDEDPEARLYR